MSFTVCALGHPHFGRYGAAGLLLVDGDRVLLQRRSKAVHMPGTWSVPGGALHAAETPTQGALREAREETGLRAQDVELIGEHAAECGGWTYTTVLARPTGQLALRTGWETDELMWLPLPGVPFLPLHPAFGQAWPALRELITRPGVEFPQGNSGA